MSRLDLVVLILEHTLPFWGPLAGAMALTWVRTAFSRPEAVTGSEAEVASTTAALTMLLMIVVLSVVLVVLIFLKVRGVLA